MSTLTTLSQFKDFLDETGSDDDAQLLSFLEGAESAVERYLHRKLKSDTYTEYLDGHGEKVLYLENRPLTEVTSVHVDNDGYYGYATDAFQAADEWTSGEEFAPQRTDESEKNASALVAIPALGKSNGFWPRGDGNIKVVYKAGYTAIPEDVVLAVHQLAKVLRSSAENGVAGALKSETQGRYAYTLLTGAEAAADSSGQDIVQAKSLLKHYREVLI